MFLVQGSSLIERPSYVLSMSTLRTLTTTNTLIADTIIGNPIVYIVGYKEKKYFVKMLKYYIKYSMH